MAGNDPYAYVDPSDTEDEDHFGSVDINGTENARKVPEIAYQVLHEDGDQKPRCCCCRSRTACFGWSFFVLILLAASLGAAYYFLIYREGSSFTPPPEPESAAPDPPDPPVNVTQAVFNITVRWNEPDFHNKAIQEYELQYALNDTILNWLTAAFVRLRVATVSRMSPATVYGFRVRARNAIGWGNFSDPAMYSTLPATVPTPPGDVMVRASDASSLKVFWAPATAQGIEITGYQLDIRRSSKGDKFSTLCIEPPAGNTCEAFDLGAAAYFDFQVRALTHSSLGNGSWSAITSFHTDYIPIEVPSPPVLGVIGPNVSWEVTLQWERPEDGGSEILGYTIERSNGTNSSVTRAIPLATPLDLPSMTWDELSPLTTYTFRATASNKLGPGNWSEPLIVTTGPASPPDAPTDMLLDNISEGLIALEWGAAVAQSAPVLSYELQRNDWWLSKPMYTTFEGDDLNYTETRELLPASTYTFQVRAINIAGPGPFSEPMNFTTNTAGGCGNPADMKIFFDTKSTMKSAIQNAIISCLGQGKTCVVNAIHNSLGLSNPCATCWAEEAQCTLVSCVTECIFPRSQACADCSQRECFPGCVTCSGVPMWAYPP